MMNNLWPNCVTNSSYDCGKNSQVLSKEEFGAEELTSKLMLLNENTMNIPMCLSSHTYILQRKGTD